MLAGSALCSQSQRYGQIRRFVHHKINYFEKLERGCDLSVLASSRFRQVKYLRSVDTATVRIVRVCMRPCLISVTPFVTSLNASFWACDSEESGLTADSSRGVVRITTFEPSPMITDFFRLGDPTQKMFRQLKIQLKAYFSGGLSRRYLK